MREIKCRGKRIDKNEWTYGYLFKFWERTYILWGTINGIPNMIEVIPETVGQYIGLLDKNNKKIYEGDIIHIGDKNIPYFIEWHDTGFMGKALRAGDRIGLAHWNNVTEVIGNIHEGEGD